MFETSGCSTGRTAHLKASLTRQAPQGNLAAARQMEFSDR
jgi:hypothetical protein